jgi:hypothetical protein
MAEQQIWVAGRGLQPVVKKTVPTVKASVYDPYQEMLNERAPGGYKAVKAKPKGTTTTKAYSAPAVKPKANTASAGKKPVATSALLAPPALTATAAGLAIPEPAKEFLGENSASIMNVDGFKPVSINTSSSMPQVSDASIPIGGSIIANDGIATVNTEPGMFDGFGQGLANLWGGTSVDAAGNKITTGIGGAEGFSNLMGGISTGYGIYSDIQNNKRADKALSMMKQDRANQYKANEDWNKNIASSGLGLASRATR